MRRATLIFLVYLIITLEGCVYHPPIQQGNIFSDKDLSILHKGMTKDQIRVILDDPVLVNIFSNNRMVYVYTFQQGKHQRMQLTHLIICLHNNHVTNFWTEKNH
ncbi:MAG: outer membrane protein assembly factor BamE [Coxiella endosymbiont of Dermacentor nuttalli]